MVLLEPNKAFIRELDEAGSFIWQTMSTPQTVDAITERVCTVFDVEKKRAKEDVEEFLGEYQRLGLVRVVRK